MKKLQETINNQIKILEKLQMNATNTGDKIEISKQIKTLVDTAITIKINTKSM